MQQTMMADDHSIRLSMAYMGIEDPNYTPADLNELFRTQAAAAHPRNGGTMEGYNALVEHYRNLFRYAAERDKKSTRTRVDGGSNKCRPKEPTKAPPGKFDNKAFNEMFEQFYEGGPLRDRGYGQLMAPTSGTREEITIAKKVDGAAGVVNAFENMPVDSHAYIVEPSGVACTNLGYLELGFEQEDFSGNSSSQNGLVYTDYMRAHTTPRIAGEDKTAGKRPQTYEEMKTAYKRDRESFKMATEEEYMEEVKREQNVHMQRMQNIATQDARIEQSFLERNAALTQWMSRIFSGGRAAQPLRGEASAAVSPTLHIWWRRDTQTWIEKSWFNISCQPYSRNMVDEFIIRSGVPMSQTDRRVFHTTDETEVSAPSCLAAKLAWVCCPCAIAVRIGNVSYSYTFQSTDSLKRFFQQDLCDTIVKHTIHVVPVWRIALWRYAFSRRFIVAGINAENIDHYALLIARNFSKFVDYLAFMRSNLRCMHTALVPRIIRVGWAFYTLLGVACTTPRIPLAASSCSRHAAVHATPKIPLTSDAKT
ncbi:hypothetical protein HXX76_014129 [Chlamydomonas incerta]|uniref:Uncharacterized protein n=1 Tax=Chlamydomonas incerta TaxID=51695 RepID=A0A835SS92_CHLIN|nr:hypothetical protein HXX76_014129 [Chlamydomonas incerta]|eukprot:KAG2424971.1 hypothetical protein HXX76_014129 [Chlamydomonas incerta]